MSEQQSTTIPSWLNKLMSIILRSPLHGIVSKSIMLITFTGRKSGKSYTTPISYSREDDMVTAFTGAKWSRNLAGGAPVILNIKNKNYQGQADLIEDSEVVAKSLRTFLNKVRSDARFYNVSFDDDGQPNWDDVQQAAKRSNMLQIKLDLPNS